jgi:azurin
MRESRSHPFPGAARSLTSPDMIRSLFLRGPLAAVAFLSLGVVASACSKPVELTIGTVGNTMSYDTANLTVPSGKTVHLTLQNKATDATMSHNWVLVKPGTAASVAEEGLKAGESAGFLPMVADVLAHTPQVKPGQSGDVTFTAPDPGAYPYLCTNPGHAQTMKGTLTVTP